jgi:hypothetical protein
MDFLAVDVPPGSLPWPESHCGVSSYPFVRNILFIKKVLEPLLNNLLSSGPKYCCRPSVHISDLRVNQFLLHCQRNITALASSSSCRFV